jgi:hypothetical protein
VPRKWRPMPIGHDAGATSSASDCSISSNRVAALAVELVDKSDDRHVAQAANLEELAGLLLDAPLGNFGGGVEHHHRAVDRGQGAVGVP